MISVVIPSKDYRKVTVVVDAVRTHDPSARIFVVDDGGLEHMGLPIHKDVTWVPGQKPFVFAKNCNLGIQAAGIDDVVLLNDDAILTTPNGFSLLQEAAICDNFGIVAAATDRVGNPSQYFNSANRALAVRAEERMVCFVAVLIRRQVIDKIGGLDERFIGYGFDDDAYCLLARKAGFRIGIWDGCLVNHTQLESSYRTEPTPEHRRKLYTNMHVYEKYYGRHPKVPQYWRDEAMRMQIDWRIL